MQAFGYSCKPQGFIHVHPSSPISGPRPQNQWLAEPFVKHFADNVRIELASQCQWCNSHPATANFSMQAHLLATRQKPNSLGTAAQHTSVLESLFNLTEQDVAPWEGAMAYCRYLEDVYFPVLLTNEFAFLWTVMGGQSRPKTVSECWPWFTTVCSVIHKLQGKASLEDVWDGVRSARPVSDVGAAAATVHESTSPTASEESACLIGIFSVLCWGSSTLKPVLHMPEAFQQVPSLFVVQKRTQEQHLSPPAFGRRQSNSKPPVHARFDDNYHGFKLESVRKRPISAIFRNVQTAMRPAARPNSHCDCSKLARSSTGAALFTSTLNYDSLQTIGKIRLKWVDHLSSHLDFDSRNRHLSVYRFPSLCALNTLQSSRGPIFDM